MEKQERMTSKRRINNFGREYGHFTQIPDEIIEHSELSMKAKMVWIKIEKHRNHRHKTAWPSMETIAQALGVSKETVRKYRKELEKHGLIETQKLGLPAHNKYTLKVPIPDDLAVDEMEEKDSDPSEEFMKIPDWVEEIHEKEDDDDGGNHDDFFDED